MLLMTSQLVFFVWYFVWLIKAITKKLRNDSVYKFDSIFVLVGAAPIAILFMSGYLHLVGLKILIKHNEPSFDKTAALFIATKIEGELGWDEGFDIWPFNYIGPTRKAAWHKNGVLFLDVEGSPDVSEGMCYNPNKVNEKGCATSIVGDWYLYRNAS